MYYFPSNSINTKEFQDDVSICGYRYKNNVNTHLMNIVMKKGTSFPKIARQLNATNFLKSMAYSLKGLRKCIYELNTGLFDIKPGNLLYSQDETDNKIYPVFIDFSADFVTPSKSAFVNLVDSFSRSLPTYGPFSPELLIVFYFKYRNIHGDDARVDKFLHDLKVDRWMDLKDRSIWKIAVDIFKDITKKTTSKMGLLKVYDKSMIYSLGMAYYDAHKKNKIITDDRVLEIISHMIVLNPLDRSTIDEVLLKIKDILGGTLARDNLLIDFSYQRNSPIIKRTIRTSPGYSQKTKSIRPLKTPVSLGVPMYTSLHLSSRPGTLSGPLKSTVKPKSKRKSSKTKSTTKELKSIILKYKREQCPAVSKMNKKKLVAALFKRRVENEDVLQMLVKKDLKGMLNRIYKRECINVSTATQSVMKKFIKKHIN